MEDMNISYRTSLRACRLCLDTECPLYCIHELQLTDKIHLLTGIKVSASDELPQHICRCCKFLLHKFLAFKDRSVNAHSVLINALVKGQMITTDYVRAIDRVLFKLSLPLAITNDTVNCLSKDYEDNESVFTEEEIKQEHISKGLEEPLVDLDSFSAKSYRFSESVAKINSTQIDPLSDKKPNEIFTDTKVEIFVSDLQDIPTVNNAFGDSWGSRNYVSCKIVNNEEADNTINCFTEGCDATFKDDLSDNDDVMHREIKTRSKTKKTKKEVIEDKSTNVDDKDVNNESSLDVDDVSKSSNTTEEDKLLLSTLKVNKETKIDLNLKLASEYITFFENYLKNHIEDIEQFSEEKQSQLERVQKVLRYNNSKVLKSIKHRELFNDWFECAKKRAKLSKKYNVEIKLFNRREQIEQFELRKQSDNYLNRPKKCETCYMAFVLELPYKRHLKLHDPSRGPVKCDICQYYYPSRSKLRKHTVEHKANYTCIQCGHVTKTWEVAKRHHLWHNGFKFECKYCSKTFEGCSTYYEHVRLAHPARHDSCHICGEGFLGAAGLRAHIKKAHRQLAVQTEADKLNGEDDACQTGLRKCEDCGECFADEELLSNHLKIHKKDFQCDLCEMSFVSAISLDVHKKRKHLNIVQRPSKKGYVVRYQNKIKLSDAAPPFVCEKCGRGFKFASSFKAHGVVHSGEKPYPCPECGKKFSQSGSVKLHIQKVHCKQTSPYKSQRQTTKGRKRRIGDETTNDLS